LRDAYHPVVAFMYGWTALIVSQSGGMAAAAITFAVYFTPLTRLGAASWQVAIATLALFTAINCFGVRQGGNAQNALMLLKLIPIVALIVAGIFFAHTASPHHVAALAPHSGLFTAFAAAMIPVLYAYDGWQTAPFASGELKEPARDMPRAMLWASFP
jgi:APA family basic amino acid/polyamine antiporter